MSACTEADRHAMHPLDRPVWASLNGAHASFAQGGPLARRYLAEVNMFASARDDSAAALDALAALLQPGEQVFVLQVAQIVVPSSLRAVQRGRGLQMVATRALGDEASRAALHCRTLGEADAGEMLQLARLTKPGPFLARTHAMGRFLGVREGEHLVAMAGERMRPPGHVEVSGVCTHPQWRGRGLARGLSATVAAAIQARGETPFLHAWVANHAAIALYRELGFVPRCEVDVAVLERA